VDNRYAYPVCFLIFAAMAGGLAYAVHSGSGRMRREAAGAKLTPTTITAAELSANGPGDNAHVTLTGLELDKDGAFVRKRRRDEHYGEVLVPAYPKGSLKLPSAKRPRAILVRTGGQNPAQLDAFLRRTTVTGLITNVERHPQGLMEPVEWRVQGRYPEKVWWLEEGKKPNEARHAENTETASYVLAALCPCLLLAAAVSFARAGNRRPQT
jgi:hypothetical protein